MSADRTTVNTSNVSQFQAINIEDLKNLFSYCKKILTNKDEFLSFIRDLGKNSFSAKMIIDKMMEVTNCDSIFTENIPSGYLEINQALRPICNAVLAFIRNEIDNNGALIRDVNNIGNFQFTSNEATEGANANNQAVEENTNNNNQSRQQATTIERTNVYKTKTNKIRVADYKYLCSLFGQRSIDYQLAKITKDILKHQTIIKCADLYSQIAIKLCDEVSAEGYKINLDDTAPVNGVQTPMIAFSELSKKVSGKMNTIIVKLLKSNSLIRQDGYFKVQDENIDSAIDQIIENKRFYGNVRGSNKVKANSDLVVNNNNNDNSEVNKKRQHEQIENQEQIENIKRSRNDNMSSATIDEESEGEINAAAVLLSGFKMGTWHHPSVNQTKPEKFVKNKPAPLQNTRQKNV